VRKMSERASKERKRGGGERERESREEETTSELGRNFGNSKKVVPRAGVNPMHVFKNKVN